MKKISLKTIRKSLSIKGKEEGDFVMLQQPSVTTEFSKEESLFGGCYTKELSGCDLGSEEEKGGQNKGRSKSESLMGSLKRRLSAKQKAKVKGGSSAIGSVDDDDTFSSSSVPIINSDEQPQNGELHLNIDENDVPVVLGLTPQDYIQYTMPLDEGMYPEGSHSFCLDSSSPMEVVTEADNGSLHTDQGQEEHELVSGMPPDLFMETSVNSILIGSAGVMLQSSRVEVPPPLSPLLPPMTSTGRIPRTFSGFSSSDSQVAERVRHHLNFDPNSAPGVSRVYDSVQSSGPMVVTSLTEELKKLARQGWYWGPITRWEAEEKLVNLADGSFLVRDSSDDRYLLSLSFRSQGKTLHTRIEHSNGRFSFYEQPDVEGHTSIVDLIEHSIKDSENGAFCYSRSRLPGSATYPVRLTNPVSRFMQVRSLQYLCRFVIRQYTRIDLIQKLPLPNKMKDYLQEKHY
uniref:Suppressor of cytokine signaling 6 n=1 Tax=Acanthochromis polyacanthus TaxID=80966 RepID=A0A3Q1FC26_9TELE